MTLDEFKQYTETFGSDMSRWPEALQQAGRMFIKNNPETANSIISSERELDDLLDSGRIKPGTDMLQARIKASIEEQARPHPIRSHRKGLSYRAAAAMVAVSFSVGVAGTSALQVASGPEPTTTQLVENDWEDIADDYGMSDLYTWVGVDSPAP